MKTRHVDTGIRLRVFAAVLAAVLALSMGAIGETKKKAKDSDKAAETKTTEKWEDAYDKLKGMPPELEDGEKKLAGKRWEMLRQTSLTSENEALSAEFASFWDELKKACNRPGMEFKVHVVESGAPICRAFSDGSIFVSSRMLEMINSQEILRTQWAHEIAHIVMQHPGSVHQREVAAKVGSILLMVAFAAAGTAISANNPMTFTSGGMTYSQYYVFYPNPIWVGGVVAAQPAPLVFAYTPSEEQYADRLALKYLKDSGQDPGVALRQLRVLGDDRLGELSAFAQSLGPDAVTAETVHAQASVPALLDISLQTYETGKEGGFNPGPVLYPPYPMGKEPAGCVDLNVAVPDAAYRGYMEAKTGEVFNAQLDICAKQFETLREKAAAGDGAASLAAVNEVFAATTAGNREVEKARSAARAELLKAVQTVAKKVAKAGKVKTLYAVNKVMPAKAGATDLTAQFQSEFHMLDSYR